MGSHPTKARCSSSLQSSSTNQQTASTPQQNSMTLPCNTALKKYVAVSLYTYPSGGPAEPTVQVGERLNVLSEEGDWWKVSSSATGKEGYIPSNYAAKVHQRWLYEGISRDKAEELLLLPYNCAGSFLIRESQTRRDSYSLSVRRSNSATWESIKHYRINRLGNGWFYISARLTFPSLQHMVDFYTDSGEGLCCTLKEPCYIQGSNNVPVQNMPEPIMVRKPTLNWKDVDSSMLFGTDKEDTEESLVSEGLREAINSYLYMTEQKGSDQGGCSKSWKTC
ncbi:src-like-adapter 2 [Polyodon spathula]|uniref:src-like-adapter 2 n=1 Tax=Polyodon spathula TaxID=7913 RepID=UPI001B7F5466|nr:src-like-adapter 2 [Polyodon spathula]